MRKLVSLLLVLVLSTALLLPVQAATGSLLFQNYDVEGNSLACYGVPLPAGGELNVSYGSEKMADATLSTIEQEQVPITVYFLVDSATSLSSEAMRQQTDILTVISSHMGEQDTMVLATIDETFAEGPLLTGKDARQAAISTIGRKNNWKTCLCSGIDAAIDSLSGSTAFHTNRFLVILSDGHDDDIEKVDVEALRSKIASAHIPVFSLVLGAASGPATTRDIEAQTQFSQATPGGEIYRLAKENLSAAQAAEAVWNTLQSTSVIHFTPSALNSEKDAEFLIRYDYEGMRFEDTLLVRAVDLGGMAPPPTVAETEPSETIEATEAPEEPEKEKPSYPLVWIAGAAVLIVAAVVIFSLLRSKKAAKAQESPELVSDASVQESISYEEATVFPAPAYESTKPVEGGIQVALVALLHPDITCEMTLAEGAETSFGRDSRAAVVLNGSDRKLSGIHGAFVWDGVHLLVRDMHSTNGTFLNGTPCAGEAWYLVENGSTLHAGGCEYRVTYQNSTNGQ